ncbi:uncharacterized protein Bfra_007322 [Botrytis fragariae]|uniref:Uncharacterized protein n=1 Tax=Botrytis fragariae TaxID=1964551 RepID=A0A8H6EDE2_9HELO|nr:uncharacterized protein Bfra_007322 [Botrytis fragariae]KAF5868126.1 hypothetical protein Bfra_007322 [Botrytis fragariae]
MSKMPVQKQHSDKLLDLKLQRKRASIRKINSETRKIKAEARWLDAQTKSIIIFNKQAKEAANGSNPGT